MKDLMAQALRLSDAGKKTQLSVKEIATFSILSIHLFFFFSIQSCLSGRTICVFPFKHGSSFAKRSRFSLYGATELSFIPVLWPF